MTASATRGARSKRGRASRVASELAIEGGDDRIVAAIDVMEEVMSSRDTRMAWLLGFLAGSGVAGESSGD